MGGWVLRDEAERAQGTDHPEVLVAQSCLTLCTPMDYSPPGSSIHGILQARILEWIAIAAGVSPKDS